MQAIDTTSTDVGEVDVELQISRHGRHYAASPGKQVVGVAQDGGTSLTFVGQGFWHMLQAHAAGSYVGVKPP